MDVSNFRLENQDFLDGSAKEYFFSKKCLLGSYLKLAEIIVEKPFAVVSGSRHTVYQLHFLQTLIFQHQTSGCRSSQPILLKTKRRDIEEHEDENKRPLLYACQIQVLKRSQWRKENLNFIREVVQT